MHESTQPVHEKAYHKNTNQECGKINIFQLHLSPNVLKYPCKWEHWIFTTQLQNKHGRGKMRLQHSYIRSLNWGEFESSRTVVLVIHGTVASGDLITKFTPWWKLRIAWVGRIGVYSVLLSQAQNLTCRKTTGHCAIAACTAFMYGGVPQVLCSAQGTA